MLRQDTWQGKIHGGHMKSGGSINRAQWTVGENWPSCIAIHFLVSCLCWHSLWSERYRYELPLLFLLALVLPNGWVMEIWPSPDSSCHVMTPPLVNQHFWTGLLVYPWSICEWIELISLTWELNYWFPDNTDGIFSKEPYLNRSTSHVSLLSHYLWFRWVERRLKHLKIIIKSRYWIN